MEVQNPEPEKSSSATMISRETVDNETRIAVETAVRDVVQQAETQVRIIVELERVRFNDILNRERDNAHRIRLDENRRICQIVYDAVLQERRDSNDFSVGTDFDDLLIN